MAKRIQRKKRVTREKLKKIMLFLVKLNLLAIPLYLAIYFNISFQPMQTFLAYLVSSFLKIIGYSFTREDFLLTTFLENKLLQIEISWDSTGWKSMYALVALIVATPISTYKDKFKFLLIGLPAIFVLNFLRIITTILISIKFGFHYFDFLHLFLWRTVLIASVLTLWYLWLKRKI